MASELIGRCVCPECNFQSAHVKIKTDKEGAHPYRHCPECGSQYFPRNKTQADHLRAKLRPENPIGKNEAPPPAPISAGPEKLEQAISAAKIVDPKTKKTKLVFGVEVPI